MDNSTDFTKDDLSPDYTNFLRTMGNTALLNGEPQVEAGVKDLWNRYTGTPSQYDADKAKARFNIRLFGEQNPDTALGASLLGVIPWLYAGSKAPAIASAAEGTPVVDSIANIASKLLAPTTPGQAAASGSADAADNED